MHKESISVMGKRVAINYRADVRAHVCPIIVASEERQGTLYYVDQEGGRHVAATFDHVWGKSDSSAILPKQKTQFQRIRKIG